MGERSAPFIRATIDLPASGATLAPGVVQATGWVFDEHGPLDAAIVMAGKRPAGNLRLGVWRPDVADAFPSIPHAGAGGFTADIDLSAAGSGPLRLSLLVCTEDGVWVEATAHQVTVEVPETAGPAARSRAVFTIVQNESQWLPLWLRYYGRYFAAHDIYVLDHDSTDGSTDGLDGRCQLVPVHRDASFEHRWLRRTVEAFQCFLLQSYETVLFAEADELVVADPHVYSGLDGYIEALQRPAARCIGFDVVQQPDEPAIEFDQPLLAQRRYWHASLGNQKRLLSRVPLHWSEGFHRELSAPDDPPDPALILVHLHRIDYEACLAHHRSTAARAWPDNEDHGAHNRIVDADAFERWYRELAAPRELIPDHIRSVL